MCISGNFILHEASQWNIDAFPLIMSLVNLDTLTEYRARAVIIHKYMWSFFVCTSECVCAASKLFDIFTDEYKPHKHIPHRRTCLIHPTMGSTVNTRTTWLRAIGSFRAIDQNRDLAESTHLSTDQLTQKGSIASGFISQKELTCMCVPARVSKGLTVISSYMHITHMHRE